MRYPRLSCLACFVFLQTGPITISNAQSKTSAVNVFDKRLETLLDHKEYFRLERLLETLKDSIDDRQKTYLQCFLDNSFNRNAESIAGIDKLLITDSNGLPDTLQAELLLMRADCYAKQFRYAKAAQDDSVVLARFAASLDSFRIPDISNNFLMYSALRNIPPQETIINQGTTVHWKKNRMSLFEIPLTIKKGEYEGIVDTKANSSCMTESYASKLGLAIFDAGMETGSRLTGIQFKTRLAVADSLYIGDILVRNAVFLVLPDAKLRFGAFSIHIIIGYPILEQLNEIQFYKDGRMMVPAIPSESTLHNLALDGPDPVISLQAGNDTVCIDLDLGAMDTKLYATYLEKYKEIVLKEGKQKNISLGGAGGSKRKKVYTLPEIRLSVENKTTILRKVDIFTEKTFPGERSYGNLGQDFINQLDGFILNFKSMFFKVM